MHPGQPLLGCAQWGTPCVTRDLGTHHGPQTPRGPPRTQPTPHTRSLQYLAFFFFLKKKKQKTAIIILINIRGRCGGPAVAGGGPVAGPVPGPPGRGRLLSGG